MDEISLKQYDALGGIHHSGHISSPFNWSGMDSVLNPDSSRYKASWEHSDVNFANLTTEKAWFKHGALLGVVLLDNVDNDWSYVALARKPGDTYRAFDVETSFETQAQATSALANSLAHGPQRNKKTKTPTLADACIATALDKHWMPNNERTQVVRELLREVAQARKFVLDPMMSRYLADLSDSFWRGGLRKRIRMLNNARQLARAPHALTWIEYSYHADYLERIRELKSQGVMDLAGNNPIRMGWLIHQHPHNEAAFRCCEIRSSTRNTDRVFVHPLGSAWCADDEPSPWRRFPSRSMLDMIKEIDSDIKRVLLDEGETSEAVVEMPGYRSTQAHWHAFLGEAHTVAMLNEITKSLDDETMVAAGTKPAVSLRALWALLATINDLPVKIEFVEPSKGYVARGSYKKFLKHSVIHLTVPETKFRKLILKSSAILRRRAHQVRGHWRKDWRNPLAPLCEHDFDDHMVCRRCQGHQIWIAEHQRGDASIGFVTHDYQLHREQQSKQ